MILILPTPPCAPALLADRVGEEPFLGDLQRLVTAIIIEVVDPPVWRVFEAQYDAVLAIDGDLAVDVRVLVHGGIVWVRDVGVRDVGE